MHNVTQAPLSFERERERPMLGSHSPCLEQPVSSQEQPIPSIPRGRQHLHIPYRKEWLGNFYQQHCSLGLGNKISQRHFWNTGRESVLQFPDRGTAFPGDTGIQAGRAMPVWCNNEGAFFLGSKASTAREPSTLACSTIFQEAKHRFEAPFP